MLSSLREVRANTELKDYIAGIEPIFWILVSRDWLVPFFSHKQTLRFHGIIKDVELTNWGWPDIRNAWTPS
ncbi:hypothetical protein [Vibrio sonorensis]|uniref:hypothetical protein n=1 Tax=Vibrio sonorensis TaxID=1004316 RepID=UPI000AA16EAD